jgi:hypothetical protein
LFGESLRASKRLAGLTFSNHSQQRKAPAQEQTVSAWVEEAVTVDRAQRILQICSQLEATLPQGEEVPGSGPVRVNLGCEGAIVKITI